MRELHEQFAVPSADFEAFAELMLQLEEQGVAVHLEGRGWFSPKHEGWIVGRLTINRKGFGFVRPVVEDDRGDIFISRSKLKDAHDRDLVLVKGRKPKRRAGPHSKGQKGPELREGRVLHVLRRSPRLVVGRYYSAGDAGVVEPIRHDSTREIHIPAGRNQDAADRDRVMVRISEEPAVNGLPSGDVVLVLGEEQTYREDLQLILAEYDLPTEFPAEVQREVEQLPKDVGPAEIKGRVDRRDVIVVTIDPEDARDFDDAITVARTSDGGYRLGVFIADVAAYVAPGSAIDREAYRRATSVYLPGQVVPMLPERLSNDLCSLRPNVDRLARAVWMQVASDGTLGEIELERTVIRSDRRFTYADVQSLIDGDEIPDLDPDLEVVLRDLAALRGLLRDRRHREGSLNLELESQRVILGEDGEVDEIVIESGDESHQLVEECMLIANEAVARVATKREFAILRRVHPEPSEEDVDSFIAFCQTVVPNFTVSGVDDFQRLIEFVRGQPASPVVNFALLRTLTQASYSPDRALHFALAKEEYCHFTSPIRRYPDLQVHRALDAAVFGEKMPKAWFAQLDSLEEVAAHCSQRERAAEDAEREMTKLRVISWLRDRVGERFKGTIAAVLEFGFFVRLNDTLAEGMVHVRSLDHDFYEFSERDRTLRGKRSGHRFALGDQVEVELVRADPIARQVDMTWIPEAGTDTKRPGKRRR